MQYNAMTRCAWATNDLAIAYHDREWGVPQHDDQRLFEFLILEGAQAGLSWNTILKKRNHYRQVFDQFDPSIVAHYDERKIAALLDDPGIVRNRLKIYSAIRNAHAFLAVQREVGCFDTYIWRSVGGEPRQNRWSSHHDVPSVTPEAEAMSKDLKRGGFNFVGPTICYALMQAIGMVNDHTVDCFRHVELSAR